MPILAIFAPFISWIFRAVVIKFGVLTAVFAVMAIVIPKVIELLVPNLSVSGLTSAFGGVDPGVWWFLDMFALDYGLPLLIYAAVARFLIRRLPLIG